MDLGAEVVEHARVLAHRALGLTGGAGGEVDVGELVGRDVDAEIAVGMVLLVGRVDEERLDSGQRVERVVERSGAAAFGQHEPAGGAGERPRDAIGREMRDRKSTRLNSSHGYISYAVFCLKKKKIKTSYVDGMPTPVVARARA